MEWLKTEILTGLQKLLCLGLERTPATDLLQGTAMAWVEVMAQGRAWDRARDTPRIRTAFVTLAANRGSWPAPRDFLAALPPAEPVKALPARPADPERAREIIEALARELRL